MQLRERILAGETGAGMTRGYRGEVSPARRAPHGPSTPGQPGDHRGGMSRAQAEHMAYGSSGGGAHDGRRNCVPKLVKPPLMRSLAASRLGANRDRRGHVGKRPCQAYEAWPGRLPRLSQAHGQTIRADGATTCRPRVQNRPTDGERQRPLRARGGTDEPACRTTASTTSSSRSDRDEHDPDWRTRIQISQ
jgi:hypothetical protein